MLDNPRGGDNSDYKKNNKNIDSNSQLNEYREHFNRTQENQFPVNTGIFFFLASSCIVGQSRNGIVSFQARLSM